MPFLRPTLSDLIERGRADVEARLPGADSRLRRSVLDVLVRTHAGAAAGLYGYLDWLARQLLPDTADAEQLARWAAIWGVSRKPATAAAGRAIFTGIAGAVVPAGSLLSAGDGLLLRVVSPAIIAPGGTAQDVEAVEPGPLLVPADTRLVFTSPVVGADAAAVLIAGVSGGSAEEADESLRARLLDRIRTPPEGGSARDYRRWMLEVPFVTRAWVYPQWLGAGSVGCTFVCDGRADIIPTDEEVAEVAALIEELRPVAARTLVFPPKPVPFPVSLRSMPNTPEVRAAIEAELADLLFREAVPGGTILISHVREAVSAAAGELDHEMVSPQGNLTAGPGELFVPAPIMWVGA